MSKLDSLKEQSLNRREVFRYLLLMLLTSISATVTVLYAVAAKLVPFYMVIFAAFGFLASAFLTILTVGIWRDLEKLSEEIKDV